MTDKDVEKLARDLMTEHGLSDWCFKLDNARVGLGSCNGRTKTITVSRHHVAHHTAKQVRDTILHEIAHALNVGDEASHGEAWKVIARRIGAAPKACADYKPIPGPWKVTCTECRRSSTKIRREQIRCRHHPDIPLQWVNTETGETWDGTPSLPKYIYVCSRCGVVSGINPKKYPYTCECRYKQKEWVKTLLEEWLDKRREAQRQE